MLQAKKILFLAQEIEPYVVPSTMATMCRNLVPAVQDTGREVRTFMPKWGHINERRNQLHEVIRLSGMNLVVDDTDHPLLIKVASITAARMQVYFIDNDDFFRRRLIDRNDSDQEYDDNVERAMFYARGVLETVKKLRWVPEVIHCQGWVSAIAAMLLKTAYNEEPSFRDCRIVYTPSASKLQKPMPQNLEGILKFKTASLQKAVKVAGGAFKNVSDLDRLGICYSDGVLLTAEDEKARALCQKKGIPCQLIPEPQEMANYVTEFFDQVWGFDKNEKVETDED